MTDRYHNDRLIQYIQCAFNARRAYVYAPTSLRRAELHYCQLVAKRPNENIIIY